MKTAGKKVGTGIPLARALSKMGVASRTVASTLILTGRVMVNGQVVRTPQHPVDMRRDRIFLDKQPVRPRTKVYLALHKPPGVVTTRQDEKGRKTVYDSLGEWGKPDGQWLAPVGRLDRASQGLLLFTNDTQWANHLLSPESHVAKVYHVQIDRHLDEPMLDRLRSGMLLDQEEQTRPAQVRVLRQGDKTQWLEITLQEGLNRQIRRMLEAVGAEVLQLIRVAIGPLQLGELKKGECRLLSPAEVAALTAPRADSDRPA